MENEKWKKINDFPLYEVSNFGRVRSTRGKKIKVLYEYIDAQGYKTVRFYNKNICSKRKTHKVVAEAFLGKSEKNVDHINGIKTDNRVENLQFLSIRENTVKYFETVYHQKSKTGCRKKKGIWVSAVHDKTRNKKLHIGSFKTEEDAYSAYLDVVKNGISAV